MEEGISCVVKGMSKENSTPLLIPSTSLQTFTFYPFYLKKKAKRLLLKIVLSWYTYQMLSFIDLYECIMGLFQIWYISIDMGTGEIWFIIKRLTYIDNTTFHSENFLIP